MNRLHGRPFTRFLLVLLVTTTLSLFPFYLRADTPDSKQTTANELFTPEVGEPAAGLLVSANETMKLKESTPAAAGGDVVSLVKQMKELLEPEGPSLRKIVISVKTEGQTIEKVAGLAVKKYPDGRRMLLVMLEPEDVKGVAFLVREMKKPTDVMWVYLPAIRRVKEIRPIEQYEHFLGTDFTYADLGFIKLHEHYKLLGEEKHNGVRAYKVEEKVPQEPLYYSRVVTWIAKKSMLPLERDYYDPAGDLLKTEVFKDVSVVDGVPTALRIVMKDAEQDSSTELDISEVDYDASLPDELFDPKQLPQISAHTIWASYICGPAKGK